MKSQWGVGIAEAVAPLVLALDVGSTASRGGLYDAHGRPVGKRAKLPHSFTSRADGTSEIDADRVVAELAAIIDRLVTRAHGVPIAGVALDTFASSMVVVGRDGAPLTPCMTYADSRPHAHVDQLRAEIAERELHQRTGTRAHASYWPARLRWLRAEHADVLERAAHVLSLGDYALRALTGALGTGTASAAWTGMADVRTADWSDEMLAIAGIDRAQVAPIHHLDQPLRLDSAGAAAVAKRWPQLAGARWFAAVADGLSANVGLGAGDSRTIGGTAATSGALRVLVRDLPDELPGGLWCYRVSHDRALVGGALNDVGRAIGWASASLAVEDGDAALARNPDPATPLVLPFFTGERSTGWAANARAVFAGVDAASDPATLYRAVVEGIAISYGRILVQLRGLAPDAAALHLGGSVTAEHPGAVQVVADALGIPITPVVIKRSTLRGTALLALETIAPDVDRIGPQHAPAREPRAERAEYYRERSARFERVYDALFS
ncbi:MAG: gluconokinase [Microbacterium sp.]|uniref:gluconokinase n=1 Tax=Microbacterium sp. TaxID=51671 RepID=UPI0039E326A5